MAASSFNLRGIPVEVMDLLKKEAKDHHISINLLILRFIEQGVGFSRKTKRTIYHDLDSLAGTWSDKDCKVFQENVKCFEKIDEELWV